MKIYSRQLNSLEDLNREKHVLQYALKHTDQLLNIKSSSKKKNVSTDAAAEAGIVGTLISAFGSKSLFNAALAIVPPIFTLIAKNTSLSKRKNPVETLAKEIMFGYLKWKGVQLVYRSIMSFTSKGKSK